MGGMVSYGLSYPSWMMLGIDWAGLIIRCGAALYSTSATSCSTRRRWLEVGSCGGLGLDVPDPY
jgi:hypothetical protein